MARQNDIETIKDLLHRGELTADQANVQMVRNDRFRMVINSLPASVRKALNAAVKTGELGHMKKDGHKPECYFHPTFKYLAVEARNKRECEIARASRSALASMSDIVSLD
ncbi:TPA: hypothetical protein L5W85_006039 [Pseudomonas aeruginosa]|jgi:hypothetical protein|uniref:hypothetical protein n=2 Tax=Pseudomonas aeruginosa TaxID=287 RepID=UPI0003901762|nr:hypothetical protein [Pseudomonas aeruginosa]HCL2633937.1 hypothetical protein [Pseudomonas aeruginosa 3C2A]ARG87525.1 hypothetical protein E613_34400 [Pseudomonas aeruginosa]ARG88716.1 hypothetical protein E613_46510 [Pseudomonas aeruginosa]ASD10598.1 hypothetical protein CD800_16440 [Pseudomonas aeruginosa]AWZ85554.1 hypothetical protein CSC41_4866 [Pseudomonas aeruginosa]